MTEADRIRDLEERLERIERRLRMRVEDERIRVTGWRRTRGIHGEGWVRDPNGTDPLPDNVMETTNPYATR